MLEDITGSNPNKDRATPTLMVTAHYVTLNRAARDALFTDPSRTRVRYYRSAAPDATYYIAPSDTGLKVDKQGRTALRLAKPADPMTLVRCTLQRVDDDVTTAQELFVLAQLDPGWTSLWRIIYPD